MEQFNVLLLLACLVITLLGSFSHWYKKHLRSEHTGGCGCYFFKEARNHTVAMLFSTTVAVTGMITSEMIPLDFLSHLSRLFTTGVMDIEMVKITTLLLTTGYTLDSSVNKGEV